jgi:hypothetical protein
LPQSYSRLYLDSLDVTKENTHLKPEQRLTGPINVFIAISSEKVEIDGATIVDFNQSTDLCKHERFTKGSSFKFNETNYASIEGSILKFAKTQRIFLNGLKDKLMPGFRLGNQRLSKLPPNLAKFLNQHPENFLRLTTIN